MSVRSFAFTGSVDPDGSEQTLFQVPDEHTLILRHAVLRVSGTGAAFVYTDAAPPAPLVITADAGTSPNGQAETPPGYWTVVPASGKLLLFGATGLSAATVKIAGALLVGVPT